ncbi:MAG: hypothetical protein Q9226_009179 [Calogaya cf. arnoldii]
MPAPDGSILPRLNGGEEALKPVRRGPSKEGYCQAHGVVLVEKFSPRCSIEPNAVPFVSSAFPWSIPQQRSGSDVDKKAPDVVRNIQDNQYVRKFRDLSAPVPAEASLSAHRKESCQSRYRKLEASNPAMILTLTPDSYDSHEIHEVHDIEAVQKSNRDDKNAVDAADKNKDMAIVAEVSESADGKGRAGASAHRDRSTNCSSIAQKNPLSVRQDPKKRPTESSDELGGALEETEAPLLLLPARKCARLSIEDSSSKMYQRVGKSPHCKYNENPESDAQGHHGATQPMTRPIKGEEWSQESEAKQDLARRLSVRFVINK